MLDKLIWGGGQGTLQLAELAIAFVLSALVGLEREFAQKSAGLRTYTIVGMSSALFMLISKYGFMDVLNDKTVVVDPSRVAAQIVSGIGFIGGGLIFVHGTSVRGLTTAASVWMVAAIGAACGAGLAVLAAATTAGYFVVVWVFTAVIAYLVPGHHRKPSKLEITYRQGQGVLQAILDTCNSMDFSVSHVTFEHQGKAEAGPKDTAEAAPMVTLHMHVSGRSPPEDLSACLAAIQGVIRVASKGEVPPVEEQP